MKIAVWGLGNHAINKILPALKENNHLELYGVHSRNNHVVNECKKKFACQSWENSNAMLNDINLDIIYVTSPTGIHSSQGKKILESNKHFWCEKPFTSSHKETKELIELSINNNLTLAEGFMYLYHPQFLWLKNFLQQYGNKEIINIDVKFTMPYPDNPGWRYNPKMGGSTLLDIGTYNLSIIFGLIENKNPEILFKEVKNIQSIPTDMNGRISLLYPSGMICNLFYGMGLPYRNEIDVITINGSVYSDKIFSKTEDYKPSFVLRDLNGNKETIKITSCNHFTSMFNYFYSLLDNKDEAQKERDRILHLSEWTDKIKNY